MRVRPFQALRPVPALAARVAAPPYDIVTRDEARALALDEPLSILHVVRADIDLPDDVSPYDATVYAKARENLEGLTARGALVREERPCLYLYREATGERAQIGVVGCVGVAEYERGIIKKHETTRPDKEDDRTRHILAVAAHAEPVLLAYRGRPELDRLVETEIRTSPLFDFSTADGIRHTVWRVADPAPYMESFDAVASAYVADGHHRSAAAARAARERSTECPGGQVTVEREWFPAVLVPASQLQILPYNRLIVDLGGRSAEEVCQRLAKVGRLSAASAELSLPPRSFGIYFGGQWRVLELDRIPVDGSDPVRSLDAALLQERVLGPVFGIADQRTDRRIDFIGGRRGARDLQARVDSGEAAMAIAMRATTVDQLIAVSDAGRMMPPKSTWFEPKLLSGLFLHALD
jgi:uncharacterized protein (DUF1015 family)